MKNNLKINYLYNLSYQVLAIIMPIITTPYISRVLNADGIGKYSYVLSIATLFAIIANLGSDAYALRQVAAEQNDRKSRSILFYEIFIIRVISTLLVLLVYIVILNRSEKEYRIIYLILTINIITVAFNINWFFQGMEEFKKIVLRDALCKISSFILIICFVRNETNVYIYALIMSLAAIVGCLSVWFYLPQYVSKITLKELNIFKHLLPSLALFMPIILLNIYTSINKIFLGWMVSDTEVGYYTQSEKIIKLIMTLITSLSIVMIPRVANMLRTCEMDKIRELLYKAIRFNFILGFPLMVGVIVISDLFIPLFLGPGFEKCILLMQILSPLILIIGIASITGQTILVSAGKQIIYTITIFFGTVINIVMNIVLIPQMYSLGATITTLLTECLITITQFLFVNKIVHFNISHIFKENYRYLTSSLIMGSVLFLLHNYFKSNIISIVLFVLIGSGIYFGQLIIIKDKAIQLFSKEIIGRLKTRLNA